MCYTRIVEPTDEELAIFRLYYCIGTVKLFYTFQVTVLKITTCKGIHRSTYGYYPKILLASHNERWESFKPTREVAHNSNFLHLGRIMSCNFNTLRLVVYMCAIKLHGRLPDSAVASHGQRN